MFGTTLSEEYNITAEAFSLSKAQLLDLATAAVQHCFCSDVEKQQLMQAFMAFKEQHQLQMQ